MNASPLRLWLGLADLITAIAVASMPAFAGFSGCGSVLGVLMCWGAAAPVAMIGIWMLVHPRTGGWVAIGLGVAAVIVAACVVNEYGVPANSGVLVWLMLLPGIVQLPIGLWLRRVVRAAPAVDCT